MLPKIVVPTFDVKLYSRPKPIKVRPYLVKEEKLLLMAQQGDDPVEVESAVNQIITNCTDGVVGVGTLPSFDLEWLFLQLRAKSVNNVISVKFRCQNPVNGTAGYVPCNADVAIDIDINDIKLTTHEGHTNKIWLSDELGVVMKYPTAPVLNLGDDIVAALSPCMETIFEANGTVHEVKDATPEELKTFVEALNLTQIAKIREFFATMPVLEHTFKFVCPKCGYKDDITLRGLQDFFV